MYQKEIVVYQAPEELANVMAQRSICGRHFLRRRSAPRGPGFRHIMRRRSQLL